MDIRDEIKQSKADKLTRPSSLRDSGQNKPENVDTGSGKVTVFMGTGVGRGSPRKWVTSDMLAGSKSVHQVFNPKPVSEFNPTTGIKVVNMGLNVADNPSDVVKADNPSDVVKGKDSVVKLSTVKVYKVKKKASGDVIENPDKVKTKLTVKKHVIQNPDKAIVKKPVDVVKMVKDKVAPVIDKNKPPKVVVNEKRSKVVKRPANVVVNDKPADVVVNEKSANVVVNEKPAAVVVNDASKFYKDNDSEKDNASSVAKKSDDVVKKASFVAKKSDDGVNKAVKDTQVSTKSDDGVNKTVKDTQALTATVEVDKGNDSALLSDWDVVRDVCLSVVDVDVKEKSAGKSKKSAIVKQNAMSDKPKKNVKKKNSRDVKENKIIVVEKSAVKVNSKDTHALSKVDVKRKRRMKTNKDDEIESSSDDVSDRKSKKHRSKAELKRKRDDGSDSDSSSVDEDKVRLFLKKMKKLKKEYVDEEESDRKSKKDGNKEEKPLTAHEEYCLKFPTIRARTVSSSLFSAINEAKINMLSFLSGIGFRSFYKVAIDKVPSRLGRYMVSKFSPKTYKVTFETGQCLQVTTSKIHEILGIPVGGISLFSLDVKPMTDAFVRLWVDQFYPKELSEIRYSDIVLKLVTAREVDFLFKLNFLTLFTNTMGRVAGLRGTICMDVVRRLTEDCDISKIDWCDYIYRCLEDSQLPEKRTVQYTGPFTFLILLYLDSTKFDRFPVVRTRPAITYWTSTLMRKRQDLETKLRVIGTLDLHDEWTESECQEAEGFTFETRKTDLLETSEREDLFKRVEGKLASICSEKVFLEDLMRKAFSYYPSDAKFVELQEKYVQLFRDPISFDVVLEDDNDNDGDDDNDNDHDGDAKMDEEDVDDGDKDPNSSNPSFGFSKINI